MMLDFSKEIKVVRLNNAVAAGTTTITTSVFNFQGTATAGQNPAGTTSTITAGFDAICVVIALGTVTATGVMTVNLQDNSLNQAGGMANITAASADVAATNTANATVTQSSTNCGLVVTDVGGNASNSLIVLDVVLAQLQFYQVVMARTVANIVIDGCFGFLYRSRERPVVHDTSVSARGYFVASS